MHRTLYNTELVSSIFDRLRFLGNDFKEGVSLWLSYYMFCFVTYHEVGHIIRGHSGYQIDPLKGPKRYYEISGLKQSAYDRAYYLCECDADAVGGQAVGDQLKEKANELSDRFHIPYSKCLLDLTLLATASICIFFLILDFQYKGPSPHYPAPMVRVASILSFILDAVSTDSSRVDIEKAVIEGMKEAFDFATVNGLRRGPYDLPIALEEFYGLGRELFDFEAQLKCYVPARAKQTSVLSKIIGKAVRHNIQRALSGVI